MNLVSGISPEGELMLCCARPGADADAAARIRTLAERKLDWPSIHRIGYRNGQLPALAKRLKQHAADLVPRDTLELLAQFTRCNGIQNQDRLKILLQVQDNFTKAGIRAVPFVDSFFSLSLYGDLEIRPCYTLDFVIERESLANAQEMLRSTGDWNPYPGTENDQSSSRRGAYLFSGPKAVGLSLQWSCAPWVHAVQLDLQAVLQRVTPSVFHGRHLPTLTPEDAALHVSLRHSLDLWVTLLMVGDVAQLLKSKPNLDWERVINLARSTGTLRGLLIGLRLAQGLLGSTLPREAARPVEKDRGVEVMAREIASKLLNATPASNRTPQTLRFHLRVRERLRDRFRYLWRFLITPTQVERALFRLPVWLGFLYVGLRPIRLAASALAHLLRRPLRSLVRRPESVSGYSPSETTVVQRMLEMAEVGPGDVVYDLGCGDGRIIIRAAKAYGARGVGIDLDPRRIRESIENARLAGVENLVEFRTEDAMRADVSAATVVSLYLPTAASLQLGPRLMQQLAPGSRVVSHNVALGEWDRAETCMSEDSPSLIYLHRVGSQRSQVQ